MVWQFGKKYSEHMNKRIETILPEDMDALAHHGWPGNVRELQSVVEGAVVVSSGEVLSLSRPAEASRPDGLRGTRTLPEAESEHLMQPVRNAEWQKGGPHETAAGV